MMYSTVIEHKKHRIHFADYTRLDEDEFIKAMRHNTQENINNEERDILLLLCVEGVHASKNILKVCIELSPTLRPYTKKIAVLGLPRMQHLFVNYLVSVFTIRARAFDDETEAKNWLVE
ncbi:MAG: hypothetical protein GY854_33935 [Deltaproteobacteria bacterium]|nr:hypothetical protein [Deltaproteobacteria bacterium]